MKVLEKLKNKHKGNRQKVPGHKKVNGNSPIPKPVTSNNSFNLIPRSNYSRLRNIE